MIKRNKNIPVICAVSIIFIPIILIFVVCQYYFISNNDNNYDYLYKDSENWGYRAQYHLSKIELSNFTLERNSKEIEDGIQRLNA